MVGKIEVGGRSRNGDAVGRSHAVGCQGGNKKIEENNGCQYDKRNCHALIKDE